MSTRSIPDQVRDALLLAADDAENRDVEVARAVRGLAYAIDDRAAIKLRALLR